VLIGKRKPEYEKVQTNAKEKLTDTTKTVNGPIESTPTQKPIINQTDQNVVVDNNTNTNK
jgi:hypothetical protein